MESIKEKLKNSNRLIFFIQKTLVFACFSLVLIGVVIIGSIELYKLIGDQSPVQVAEAAFKGNLSGKEGGFVAAKSGKSYYFPWCGAVNRIKSANLVWFRDRASAELLGYKPAANCHGLK